MTEIDLVPGDYRRLSWLRGRVRTTVTVMLTALLVSMVAWAGLHFLSARLDTQITVLQSKQAITNQQREALTQLDTHKTALQRKLELLTGLRGGAEAAQMFVTIDRAMQGDDVWFLDWEFRRAGSTVKHKPETASNGYFILIPAEDGQASTEAWKIDTHMTLRGQARDHSALSGFVRRLYRQGAIQDVRILDTSRQTQNDMVDFRLAVTVNSTGESS
ncbi:MAG: hypothetical protein WBO34_08690 [Gammaproteobacteria bacterium]